MSADEKFAVWKVEGGWEYHFPEPVSRAEAIERIEECEAGTNNLPPFYVLDGVER